MTKQAGLSDEVAAVRRFTRFYTGLIGLLDENLLRSGFSLTEGRLLYELAHRDRTTATDLATGLRLDPGYLSRILKGFEERGLLVRAPSAEDGRRSLIALTAAGRDAFAPLDESSREDVTALIAPLPATARGELVGAMARIETLLSPAPSEAGEPFRLRAPRVGDMGWIAHRQGVIYAEEYGFDWTFEALVAEIVARFVKEFDPARERCWIAERHGAVVGSIFVARQSDEVAKLRLLYVEPGARGLGIGRRLTEECIRFAQETGYRRLTLWTNDNLLPAIRIYQEAGFQLEAEERHRSFGHDLVGQTWTLDL